MTVYRHPENIHFKFVLLTLRRRSEKETSVLNAFAYEQAQVFDRHDLDSVVEGDPAELLDHIWTRDNCRPQSQFDSDRGNGASSGCFVKPRSKECGWV